MSVNDVLDREADRPAYVRFERRAVKDAQASDEAGHYVSKDEDWALITPPYSKDCIEKKVDSWFAQVKLNVMNNRVPQRHFDLWKESYEHFKNGQEPPLDGTSVKDWNALSPAQCKNLIAAGCKTIEDLAQANDEGLRRIGMGAHDLKAKAIAWLQAAKDHGPLMAKVEATEKENKQLKGTVESLQEQIRLLSLQLDSRETQTVTHPVATSIPSVTITTSDILGTPAERYEQKFGKKPHHRMNEETILRKLEE